NPAQNVVADLTNACALKCPKIRNIFYHNKNSALAAPWIGADRAGAHGVDIAANLAAAHGRNGPVECRRQRYHELVLALYEVQNGAAGRAWTKPWQACQKLDQLFDFRSAGGQRCVTKEGIG